MSDTRHNRLAGLIPLAQELSLDSGVHAEWRTRHALPVQAFATQIVLEGVPHSGRRDDRGSSCRPTAH